MKTKMLAIALESGRESSRMSQACGFVSMTIVRREGERSEFC